MQEIITVLELPTKESRSTSVSLLPRNGIWIWSLSRARMHSLRAKRLLFISAPSILVCRSLSVVSAPRSLPARSIKEIFPTSFPSLESFPSLFLLESFTSLCFLMASCKIACDLEDSSLAPVDPVLLAAFPLSIYSLTICTSDTSNSCSPTMQTCCRPSSLMQSFFLSLRRSKSFPPYISK
uniref:Kinesin-like protein n=1 Tax=Rhizophora mucronata TaxID=61149 RepID=A0A2P2MI06_RHIMU